MGFIAHLIVICIFCRYGFVAKNTHTHSNCTRDGASDEILYSASHFIQVVLTFYNWHCRIANNGVRVLSIVQRVYQFIAKGSRSFNTHIISNATVFRNANDEW